jgi:trans-aconitate methyltransferase
MTRADESTNRWDAEDYDGDHAFVYEYGERLVETLDPQPDERILDLGCGTGHLTGDIAERGATVLGVDQSAEMVAEACERYPALDFERADAREFGTEDSFDAVFSNAVLHWIPDADQDAVLETVRDALVPGGRFVAEMGGTGNVERIVSATLEELQDRGYDADHPWYFPSIGAYTPRLERHGFEVRRAVLFDRPTELDGGAAGLRNWLGMFGDSLFADLSAEEQEAVVSAVEDRLRPDMYEKATETWTADYRRLRFVAVREKA